MNLASAGNAITNIVNALEKIEVGPRGLYKSSQEKIANIKSSAMQIIELCDKLVPSSDNADDIFISDSQIDNNVDNKQSKSTLQVENLVEVLANLQSTCNALEQVIANQSDKASTQISNHLIPAVSGVLEETVQDTQEHPAETLVEKSDSEHSSVSTSSNSNISKSTRRQAMAIYADVLSKFNNLNTGYAKVDKCGKLLSDWFLKRFNTYSPNFKYNIAMIPKWMGDIVCCYAYYDSIRKVDQFLNQFYNWLSKLSDATASYAIPYIVYDYSHMSNSTEKYPISALLIWDILLDAGLESHTRDLPCKLRIDRDLVLSTLQLYHGNTIDRYDKNPYLYMNKLAGTSSSDATSMSDISPIIENHSNSPPHHWDIL